MIDNLDIFNDTISVGYYSLSEMKTALIKDTAWNSKFNKKHIKTLFQIIDKHIEQYFQINPL